METTTKTIKQLIAEYNKLTGLDIKRIATKEDIMKRLLKAKTKRGIETVKTIDENAEINISELRKSINPIRSKATSETWNDPIIATKRSARYKVEVNGDQFNSLGKAFDSLGISRKHLIQQRLLLVHDGYVIVDSQDQKFTFRLINQKQ